LRDRTLGPWPAYYVVRRKTLAGAGFGKAFRRAREKGFRGDPPEADDEKAPVTFMVENPQQSAIFIENVVRRAAPAAAQALSRRKKRNVVLLGDFRHQLREVLR